MSLVAFVLGAALFILLVVLVLRLFLQGANSGERRYLAGTGRRPGSHPALTSSEPPAEEEKD